MSEKHVLVQGGLVYCSQSVSNNSPATSVPISVTSQTLVDANGGKLVATPDDDSVINMNFGLCNDPKYKVPPPCQAKVKWSKMYEGVQIEEKSLLILTEASEAMCNVCSVPGHIKVGYHGQQATVVADTMAEAESEIMEQLNPMAEPIVKEFDDEEIKLFTVKTDNKLATINQINDSTIH